MKTKKLVTSSMLLAIAMVLSIIQPFSLPFGGGVTVASMAPVCIIAILYGTKQGLFAGAVYGVIQMLMGAKTVAAFFMPGDSQMTIFAAVSVCLLDYIIAYSVIGFAGVFKTKIKNTTVAVTVGTVFALCLRYVVHIISGAIFFGSWAEWFFTQEGFYAIGEKIMTAFSGWGLSVVYSVFYNGLYMIPEIIITAVVTPVVYRCLLKSNMI
jgi:thiamine transporter